MILSKLKLCKTFETWHKKLLSSVENFLHSLPNFAAAHAKYSDVGLAEKIIFCLWPDAGPWGLQCKIFVASMIYEQ